MPPSSRFRLIRNGWVGALAVLGLVALISFAYIGGLLGPFPAAAATITVTTAVDADPPANDGDCSLREAIDNANDDAQTWTDCEAGTGNDTIVFDDGLALITLADGLPDITDTDGLTIDGANAVTISGATLYRPFAVEADASLTLQRVTSTFGLASGASGGNVFNQGTLTLIETSITNSNATINGGGINNTGTGIVSLVDSTISGSSAITGSGGGIYSDGGSLTLDNSALSGNSAALGGGGISGEQTTVQITNGSELSANIASVNSGGIGLGQGTLTISDSSITGNTAANFGGGINADETTTTLTNVTISDNTATTFGGGGIQHQIGILTIANSTISGNFAGTDGGGMRNVAGAITTLIDSEISGNTVSDQGGGIFNGTGASLTMSGSTVSGNVAATGGGIRTNFGAATIANSTFSRNEAGFGGAIYNGEDATTTLTNVTISDNTATADGGGLYNPGDAAGDILLANTIVADQQAGEDCGGSGSFLSLGNNLDSDNTCNLIAAGDLPNGNANLGPLADNGGPTHTHALVTSSDAIDAGDDATCAAPPVDGLDQRGVIRPQLAACDIGAFELEPEPTPTPTPTPADETPAPTPSPTPTPSGQTLSPTPTATPGPGLLQGDNDCDGDADSVDALKGLQYIAAIGFSQEAGCPALGGAVPAGEAPDLFGDVDCDDDVDSVDGLKILQSVAAIPFSQNEPCTDIGAPF